LLATGLGAARGFYHDLLGLEIVGENDRHIAFRCGGGTQLAVTKSTAGTAGTWTQATWLVQDLRAEVDSLRSRGVNVEEYDLPGLTTQDGIADIGFAWAAWVIDPAGNTLGDAQMKPGGNHRGARGNSLGQRLPQVNPQPYARRARCTSSRRHHKRRAE
jgi:catechol 2,3-dioxygenase-like lactoylglutathione lyase family enzyme